MSPDSGDQAARLERALAAFREVARQRIQARHGGRLKQRDVPAPAASRTPVSKYGFFWRLFSAGRTPPPEA